LRQIPGKGSAGYMFCCAALICASLLNCQVSFAQAVRRKDVTWVSPRAVPLRLNGYEVKAVTEPNSARRAYIRRDTDSKWIRCYTGERYLLMTLGNRRRVVLINDCPATKFCKVMIADLASHESRQIDQPAIEMYQRDARPDNRLIVEDPGNFPVTSRIVHADLSAQHILYADESVTGILDWGDVCLGDPDYDFSYLYGDLGEAFVRDVALQYGHNDPDRLVRKAHCFSVVDQIGTIVCGAGRALAGDEAAAWQRLRAQLHEANGI
jgi:phosphotransferase family enzyme